MRVLQMDFESYFKQNPRAATTLSKSTLDKYSKSSTTLPEDLHYDADKLFRLFLKPDMMVRRPILSRVVFIIILFCGERSTLLRQVDMKQSSRVRDRMPVRWRS